MNNLKEQTISGIKWQVGMSLLQKIISFGATIILARHLGPSVFGLFALTLIIIGSFELFKSIGIDTALIRRKDDFEKAANTAFFIIPTLGVILYILLNFLSPLIGNSLNNKELIPVIRILGIVFIFTSFLRIPAVCLERNMRFKEISIAEFFSALLFSLSAIILAFLNFGVWALVYAYVIKMFVYMIMILVYAKWKPKFEFDKKIALEMFHFGKFIFLTAVVWFLKMNLDNLLVGKLLGVTMLGFYAVAFNIANFLGDYLGNKVYKVVYPAYSKLQNNIEGLKRACLQTLKYLSIIAFPFGTGIFLLGGDFLQFAYGQTWIGAAGVLKILAWAGIFNTLPASFAGIFLTFNKPKIGFWIILLQVIIFFALISPMAKSLGLNGVGLVVAFASFISCFVTVIMAMKILSVNLSEIYISLRPPLLSSLIMASAILFIKEIILRFQLIHNSNYNFIFLFAVSLMVYGFSLSKIELNLNSELKKIIFT